MSDFLVWTWILINKWNSIYRNWTNINNETFKKKDLTSPKVKILNLRKLTTRAFPIIKMNFPFEGRIFTIFSREQIGFEIVVYGALLWCFWNIFFPPPFHMSPFHVTFARFRETSPFPSSRACNTCVFPETAPTLLSTNSSCFGRDQYVSDSRDDSKMM